MYIYIYFNSKSTPLKAQKKFIAPVTPQEPNPKEEFSLF